MSNALWFLLVGALMLIMGLHSSIIKRLPITTAVLYLAVGLVFGPTLLGFYHFNPLRESALLEVLTEVAVLISLFAAGVKMPVSLPVSRWRTPLLLATGSMTVTIGMVALFAYYLLGLPLGAAVLLGAILAPTDPVLATDIQSRHPGDRDRLRFYLTCEAGMNDGTAFPFVMLGMGLLGLHELGDYGIRWTLVDVLWATTAGVCTGVLMGRLLGWLGYRLRYGPDGKALMDDFIGLGLIGVVYGVSELIEAWGFLAVFFAAVSLRRTELTLVSSATGCPVETDADKLIQESDDDEYNFPLPTVSEGSLIFKEHLERLSELLLVLLVGGSLFIDSWSWWAVGLTLFLFFIVRPISVMIGLQGSRVPWRIRAMLGWFGVRGIGSLYYLMYAIQHGLPEEIGLDLIHLTLIVVTLSILLHGITATPLMNRFQSG